MQPLPSKDESPQPHQSSQPHDSSHVGCARQDCAHNNQRRRCLVSRDGHVQQAAAVIHARECHGLSVEVADCVWQEVQRRAFGVIKHHLRAQPQFEARPQQSNPIQSYSKPLPIGCIVHMVEILPSLSLNTTCMHSHCHQLAMINPEAYGYNVEKTPDKGWKCSAGLRRSLRSALAAKF